MKYKNRALVLAWDIVYSGQVPDIAGVGLAMCSERAFCDRENRLDFNFSLFQIRHSYNYRSLRIALL